MSVPPTWLSLENSFVSGVGWVKPGDAYPSGSSSGTHEHGGDPTVT